MATSALGFDNFFSTTLSSSITASDTVIPLNAVPVASEGYLTLDQDNASKEIIYYTSKGASSVTCPSVGAGRGVGGTSAVSHSSGATAKMNVVAEHLEALQDGSGLAVNTPWASWSPSWSGVSGGTSSAYYQQIGKLVFFRVKYTLAGAGLSGDPTFTLPVTSITYPNTYWTLGPGDSFDSSASSTVYGRVAWITTTTAAIRCAFAANSYVTDSGMNSTVPFTWAVNDYVQAKGYYEAA